MPKHFEFVEHSLPRFEEQVLIGNKSNEDPDSGNA
jgi:hypothetical protein